jgi:hypothetical protein
VKAKKGPLSSKAASHVESLPSIHPSIHHVAGAGKRNTVHQTQTKEQQFRWQDLARGRKQEQLCLLKLQQQIGYFSEEIPVQKKDDDASGSSARAKFGLNPSRI